MTIPGRPARTVFAAPPPRTLHTADGVRLAATHLPGPAGARLAVVVAHGFGGGLHQPALQAVLTGLARRVGVVGFDFRGHGRSGGESTVGDLEVLDVDAAVAAARRLGYPLVVTLGFSMGASAVLRQAGLAPGGALAHPPDAVVSVSSASRWFQRDTPAMRRLHWLVLNPSGRRLTRFWPGVRVAATGWEPVPESPVEVVGRIAPRPLLLVHGDADRYLPMRHLDELRAAAGPAAEIWVEPGFGHAELALPPHLLDRLTDRIAELA